MRRLVTLTACVLAVVLGALVPRATADWTPIEPHPAGCADNGWWAKRIDAATIRVVNPLIADWQIGDFVINGTTYHWRVVEQVVDKPYCQGFRTVIRAKVPKNQFHYFWYAADGSWLEDGWKGVRK